VVVAVLALEVVGAVEDDFVVVPKMILRFFLDRRRTLEGQPFVGERDPRLRRFRMRYVLQMELERSFEVRYLLEV
jgi:hypothetical protein